MRQAFKAFDTPVNTYSNSTVIWHFDSNQFTFVVYTIGEHPMISIRTITVMGTIAALTLLSPCFVQNKAIANDVEEGNPGRGITGTWRVNVDPRPNPAGNPEAFFSYITFNRGGTLIESGSDALEGSRPGHGIWMRTSRNELKFVFEKFIEFNPILEQKGIFVFRVEEKVTFTGENSYQGAAQVSICNRAGQECFPLGASDTKGMRLVGF